MRRHLRILLTLTLFISAAVAGCSPTSPSVLQSPPPPPPPPPPGGTVLNGTVQNMAWQPLEGARVEAVAGAGAGVAAIVDSLGHFSLSGPFDETTQVRATANGHVEATLPFPPACTTCTNPQRYLTFYLDSEIPHADLAGNYQATFVAASECSTLPDVARERTVAATVSRNSFVNSTNAQYAMTFTGATVLGFSRGAAIGVAGDYLSLWLTGVHGDHGSGLVEEVATHTYVKLEGEADGQLGSDANVIALPFNGSIEHCTMSGPMTSPYDLCSSPTTTQLQCISPNHRLVLRRLS